jgi:hypothetical protein
VIGHGAERRDDAWKEIVADDVVEVMKHCRRRLRVRSNDDLQRNGDDKRTDDPVSALLERRNFSRDGSFEDVRAAGRDR